MLLRADGIVCAVRSHGENGAVVRILTREHGLLAGYVRGARSRLLRPILLPGNYVAAEQRSRVQDQLGGMTVDLIRSRAGLLQQPLSALAMEWTTALTASALPEGHAYPALFDGLGALLDALENAPSARRWLPALAGYEALLVVQLGYAGSTQNDTADARQRLTRHRGLLESQILPPRQAAALMALRDRLLEWLDRAVA